jgi:hypothetical protein
MLMNPEQRETKRAYDAAYSAAYRVAHKEEMAAYMATYHAAHREEERAFANAYEAAHKDEIREQKAEFRGWLQILRTVNGCEDCETHEGFLEHHHVDPDTKRYDISRMARHSLDALEDELEKCVVLCRSCHRTRHVEMREA